MSYLTVRAASSPELVTLRSAGQWSKLYFIPFVPSTVYTARLASLPSSFDKVTQVGFVSGSGTLANVLPDMTMLVGSTAGAFDLGIVRIRKTPIAGTFYIGEESDANWQGSCYLTVTNEVDIWAKHIVTVDDDTFYMDTDVTYSDQNSVFSPVPIMGGQRILKKVSTSISTQYDFSNSYCLGSSISAYSVTCSTALSITGATTSTPTLAFNTLGWHMVVLTITAANGKVSVGIRYVFVYDKDHLPTPVIQLDTCEVDYATGGWSYNVTVQDTIGFGILPERTMCVLFAEDYYAGIQTSIGQLAGCENVICVGKVLDEEYDLNSEQNFVTLTVEGYHSWLQRVFAFPTGVILTDTTPTNWAEMQSPTVDKVVLRLLQWGSTFTKLADVYLTNDTRLASELTSPASNLWAQMVEIASTSIQATCGVDRFGRLFVEIEPQLVPASSRTWATVMELTSADWRNSIHMQRVFVSPTGMVNASGVSVSSDGTGAALFSLTPGHIFKHYGEPETLDRLLLSTQSFSNHLTGLVLGWRNNPFPNSESELSENNRMLDCFPRQKVHWELSSNGNPRGVSFDADFIPRRVSFSWNKESGFMNTNLLLEMEATEQVSADGDIPGDGGADSSAPPEPPAYPPMPDFPILIPGDIPGNNSGRVLMLDAVYGLLYTESYNSGSPQWEQVNSGLGTIPYPVTDPAGGLRGKFLYQLGFDFHVMPNGSVYLYRTQDHGYVSTETDDYYFVARAPSIGGTFVTIMDWIADRTAGNIAPFGYWTSLVGFGYDLSVAERVAYLYRRSIGGAPVFNQFYVGSGGVMVPGATGVQPGAFGERSRCGISYGLGKWLVTGKSAYLLMSSDGSTIDTPSASDHVDKDGISQDPLIRASATGIVITPGDAASLVSTHTLVTSVDNLVTPVYNDDSNLLGNAFDGMACDPTGQYLMCQYGVGGKGHSGDYGGSWSLLPSLPVGNWKFSNAGHPTHWIAAGGTAIRGSEDGGSSWINKEGNYTADFPTGNIIAVQWLG